MNALRETNQLKAVVAEIPSARSVQVRIINPTANSEWDQIIQALGSASVFHTSAWARVLLDAYRYTPCYFTAFRGDTPVAAIPLMEVDSLLTGRRGVGLPFSDFCDPLFSSPEACSQLLDAAMCHGRTRGWRYLELRRAARIIPNTPASACYYGHVLRLEVDRERTTNDNVPSPAHSGTLSHPMGEGWGEGILNLVNHPDRQESAVDGATRPTNPCKEKKERSNVSEKFDSSVRRAIRKAERAGVTTEISSDLPAVREFYRLHCLTRRAHGVPPQPFKFFECLQKHVLLPGNGFVVIARSNGSPIAAAVFGHTARHAIYKFGASDSKFQELRGNNVVMNRAIEWCIQNGMESLDFGRTDTTNEGLRRFKLGWGAEEHEIRYARHDLRQNRTVEQSVEPREPGSAICRRLPVSLLRLAGKILYRHMG